MNSVQKPGTIIPQFMLVALGLSFLVSSFFGAFPDADVVKHYDANNIGAGSSWLRGAVELIAAFLLMIPRVQIGAAIAVALGMVFVIVTSPDRVESLWVTFRPFLVLIVCCVCAVWLFVAGSEPAKQ